MKPFTPVPRHIEERLHIAILTGERLDLHWADESSSRAYVSRVEPLAVVEDGGLPYLKARNDEGTEVRIRLDLIRNLPTPVK